MKRAALAGVFGLVLAVGGLLAAAASGAGPLSMLATTTSTTSTTSTTPVPVIADGVTIGGVSVGGMTSDGAYTAVNAAFSAPLVIIVRKHELAPHPGQIGAAARIGEAVARAGSAAPGTSIPLGVSVNRSRVRKYVAVVANRFDTKPLDAQLYLRNLRPWIAKPVVGLELYRGRAEAAIVSALTANRHGPLRFRQKVIKPTVTRTNFGAVIVIRRGSNRLYLYSGMHPRRVFPVATGQAIYPTPLGRFQIVVKWRNPWWYPPNSSWARGLKPVPPGPGNPLGTRWMGLSAPGVGIHGTPDSASIGYSASHGCIRMRIPDAEWLFGQVRIGTTVFIVSA
ncbi:MAG: L,D-transpeptidase family protein [Gaiellaceae bacterium]